MGFSEVLLIKPKLDQSEAKKMEDDLHGRFGRVATKFGKGLLKALVGGGVITAALSAINRLLNPLEEIEDRIKALLGQSDSISDSAEKFGTTAGQFFKLQQLGHAAGLDDAGLKELLTKFKDAQDLAKKEIANGGDEHRSTVAIRQFANEKDVASALFRVLQDMQTQSKDVRESNQRAIFGDKLSGSARRFADSDFSGVSKKLGVENSDQLNEAFKKTGDISNLNRALEARRNVEGFLNQSKNVTPELVEAIDKIQTATANREAQQLGAIQNLEKAAVTIDAIKGLVDSGLNQVERLFGLLAPIAPAINAIAQGRGLRIGGFNLFGGGK